MAKKIEIYKISRKLERQTEKIKESKTISETNKQDILRFKDYCASIGLTETRALFYIAKLSRIAGWLGKDFKSAEESDLLQVVGKIERNERYTEHTKQNYKV